MRTGADEELAPKYGYVERERRWLIGSTRLPPLPSAHILIEDRYITGTRMRLRRMTDSVTGEVALKLAKKYESVDPTARRMVNAYLTEAEYRVFVALPGATIVKRRFALEGFSVDIFESMLASLVLAEQEAADAGSLAAIKPPRWAQREVTQDERFQGGALAWLSSEQLPALLAET